MSGQQEPERIGATMNTIKDSICDCNKERLLKCHIFLSKARRVADPRGVEVIERELERIREKYLFLESLGLNEEMRIK